MLESRKRFKWVALFLLMAIVLPLVSCGGEGAPTNVNVQTVTNTPTATFTIPPEPTGATGTLSSVSGEVTVLRQGVDTWFNATSGMKLGTGDSLKTGSDGYVLIVFFDGSVMEVEADSEISVEELSVASGTGSTTVSIFQLVGNTVNRVEQLIDSSSKYEVETPAGSAVVRGTIFNLGVSPYGLSCINTLDEDDVASHCAYFTGTGKTVDVCEKKKSCCWPGSPPSDPFYTDTNEDPTNWGGDGASSQCHSTAMPDSTYPYPTFTYPSPTPTGTTGPTGPIG